MPKLKQMPFVYQGVKFTPEIPLYLAMYSAINHRLCVDIHMDPKRGGGSMRKESKKRYACCTQKDLDALLTVEIAPCKKGCGNMAFIKDVSGYRESGMCEHCWMNAFDLKNASYTEKLLAGVAKKDLKMKTQGFTHKVDLMVHPSEGGDDYSLVMYQKGKPTPAEITALLRKRGSCIFNDWSITNL